MTRRTDAERIKDIDARMEKLKQEKRRLQNAQTAEDRKKRTKRLIQGGAIIEKAIGEEIDLDALERMMFADVSCVRAAYRAALGKASETEPPVEEEPGETVVIEKGMVNIQTVKFIITLNMLAEQTRNGFTPFSEYDGATGGDGIVYADGESGNPVICDMMVGCGHHIVVSRYAQKFEGFSFNVHKHKERPKHFFIDVEGPSGFRAVVEDGRWYMI